MKFLPLRDLDSINRALSFDTPDCRVIGGCEIYTTKAAGGDKKLYKNVSATIANRYEADLRLSESLSPPDHPMESRAVYQSLHSPFGPLDQSTARRTFAYLIATLNASHMDYDFSSVLRPSDFRKERSVRKVINTFNTTLLNIGVSVSTSLPRLWETIDAQMDLKNCLIFSYAPDDIENDPYGEDGLIWSCVYFFFNKHRKRVCYLSLRGISALSHSPTERMTLSAMKRGPQEPFSWEDSDDTEPDEDNHSIWGDGESWDDEMIEGMEV